MSARFITFEGLDGSGKSTHLAQAAVWMAERALPVVVTHEPGGAPLCDAIRLLFLDHRWGQMDGRVEALLVFASRRQHLLEVIEPALAAGTHVFCDRFTDSTRAYQGRGRGLELGWIEALDQLATAGRVPDHTLLFDLPAELARERGHSPKRQQRASGIDRLDAEDLEFYRRVRGGYLETAEREPERVRVIDSSGEKEATWSQVAVALGEIFGGQ